MEDQAEEAAVAVVCDRSTNGGLARCEVEAECPDVITEIRGSGSACGLGIGVAVGGGQISAG